MNTPGEMGKSAEERFHRLLRWYPKSWRDDNEAVLLGIMLDNAERQGRTAPSVGERYSAVVYGLGARLDARLALWTALAALAISAVAGALMVWAPYPLATVGVGWMLPLLSVAVCPGLVAVGALSLARHRGLVSEPRVLAVLGLLAMALPLAALTQIGWGMGFDAADRGAPSTGLAALWAPLFVVAWMLGAAATGLLVDALLEGTRLRSVVRAGCALLSGAIVVPVIGLALITPYASAIAAAGLALLAIVPVSTIIPVRKSRSTEHAVAPTAAPGDFPLRTRTLARTLSWIAAITSAVGIAYALTGSRWSPGAVDGTVAMGRGITIALVSAMPLLAAIGLIAATRTLARTRRSPAHIWWPSTLVALSFMAVAVAYLNAPAWDGMAPGFAVASVLAGTAIAWWMTPRLRGPRRTRIAVSVLIGFGYAVFLGMLVAPMLAFALPVLACTFAIWGTRGPRPTVLGAPLVATVPAHAASDDAAVPSTS
ncbi:hypothetical protein [Luethyella okanaganae]|uniref:Integral membrane protein n=1 Tax=Luethyella okanaganae TaxID=69372 RepID=A0ABW1VK11_9MICO